MIEDPEAFARDADAASWLYLCGEEFAAVEGGRPRASLLILQPQGAGRA